MAGVCFRISKAICVLMIAALGMRAMNMNPTDNKQEIKRYRLGQRLGDALVNGSVVFTGAIQSLGELHKEPGEADEDRAMKVRSVRLKVTEWLYGEGHAETVELLDSVRPAMTKTSLGPWLAWEGATLNVGGQLLVVRWAPLTPRPDWHGVPEDVALVVSDATLFPSMREAVSQHQRFERDPTEIAKIPQLLREKHDSLLAGFAVKYLMDREAIRDVDKAATILSKLLGNEAVPEQGRQDIADGLVSDYYRLQEPTRRIVAETLIVSASAHDSNAAYPALVALARLCDLHLLNLKLFLTPERQHKIVENYRAFREHNTSEPEHPEFESQLGLL